MLSEHRLAWVAFKGIERSGLHGNSKYSVHNFSEDSTSSWKHTLVVQRWCWRREIVCHHHTEQSALRWIYDSKERDERGMVVIRCYQLQQFHRFKLQISLYLSLCYLLSLWAMPMMTFNCTNTHTHTRRAKSFNRGKFLFFTTRHHFMSNRFSSCPAYTEECL